MSSHPEIPLLALLVLAAGCRSTDERKGEGDVRYLITQGRYEDAQTVAQRHVQDDPSPRAEKDLQAARTALLLDRARTLSFADRDDEALALLTEAEAISPDSPQVQQWLKKTRHKQGLHWFYIARDRHIEDDLPGAVEAYQRALSFQPTMELAISGLARVGRQLEYRAELAEDYYNEGLGALRDDELRLAKSRFLYANKYRAWDPKPARRVGQVEVSIAERVVLSAEELEVDGHYAAARAEYAAALRLDSENVLAQDGLERMEVEAKADRLLGAGEMWRLRGEWDKAEEVLREGLEVTVVQEDRFLDALQDIEQDRTADHYDRALNLERDFRYHEAIETYRALLDERGFYEDARARLTTLEATVQEVEGLYAQLPELEGDPQAQEELLRRIDALWPEYADVEERLQALAASRK